MEYVAPWMEGLHSSQTDVPRVLEFGCGDGFQIPYLQKIGKVTALDVCLSETLQRVPGVRFCEASVTETPFEEHCFDMIFSNHVIEHLDSPERAFSELKRIGKESCLYAFSVPTHLWLLLSIPAQYYNLLKKGLRKISALFRTLESSSPFEGKINRTEGQGHA